MRKLIISLLIVVFISCSTLGTINHVYQSIGLEFVETIAISPAIILNYEYQNMSNFATKKLIEELNKLIKYKYIYPDSLINLCQNENHVIINKYNLFDAANRANADLFLSCSIKYIYKTFESDKNAIVNITLHSVSTGELVASSEHNTYKGNSYFLPPNRQKSTSDGIAGAVKGLFNKMRKVIDNE